MSDCIFCKIVKGEMPCHKVYEDENCFGFLTIEPIAKGHTLIISKKHYENIFDIPEKEAKDVISAVRKISRSMKKSLKLDGINLLNANGEISGQSVFHWHIHIVPRYKNDGLETWPKSNFKDKDLKMTNEQIKKGL